MRNLKKMKSEDIRKIVLSKYKKSETPTKIFRDLNGCVGLRTIERWCKIVRETGSIKMSYSTGRYRSARTKTNVQKIKKALKNHKLSSTRKLSKKYKISRTSVRRILKNDLNLKPYKRVSVPLITEAHILQRKKFANWVRTNFSKQKTMRILFSDEKIFDTNGICNSQNERLWCINREEANKNGGTHKEKKFPPKVMVWLGACSKGLSPLVIFDKGTIDHKKYIKNVLPVALKYGNEAFGNDWTFQQDGATPHTADKTQQWCSENFPSFIDKDHWHANSPDLNPLDYSIWNEFANSIKWDKVTSKKTLIHEIKLAAKRIPLSVVFESCKTWTNRLYRLSKTNYAYLN